MTAEITAESLLDEPVGGPAAIRLLGDLLPAAAQVNDLSRRELTEVLRSDATARLATDGRLHYVEPAPSDLPNEPLRPSAARSAEAPLSETFALHSNPGAQRTILLDFDGQSVSGTVWNSNYGVADAVHPGWDPGRDGAGFSDGERMSIQQIWSMVSEDFAPYDVDVTTEDPGQAGLERSSSADTTYGVRALISPSSNAFTNICQQQCGGVAFVSVFDAIGSAYQPAWVFPQALGDSAKAIAEATSHEVGHNLALQHDGTATEGYYTGHGSWAPIMGVGYDRPITQWSKGEYSGANNRQDDLALIGGYLGKRADEPGGTIPQTGYITSAADNDVFALGKCTANSQVVVRSPFAAPNLDVRARLRAPDGTVVATVNPASGTTNAVTAYGMDATVSIPTDGRYSLDIDGSGSGHEIGGVSTGYTTYGSIGAYQIVATGCDSDLAGLPGSPAGLVESSAPTQSSVSIGWSEPPVAGDSPITQYVISQGNGPVTTVGADSRAITLNNLAPSTSYDITVSAVNSRGAGAPAAIRLRTAATPATVPTAPQDVFGLWNSSQRRPEVYWQPPASDGGAAIDSYALYVDDAYVGALPSTSRGAYFNGTFAVGTHEVSVMARNSAGLSPAGTSSFTVPPADTAGPVTSDFDFTPKSVDVTDGARQVTVSVRLTDATGAEAPTMIVDSDETDQSLGFGSMTRVSGSAQDGRYERTLTIPTTAAAGNWTVRLYPTRDTLGNNGDSFRDHPTKLVVSKEQPPTAPQAPTDVNATPGDAQATVSWTPPTNNGGAPITSYTITSTPGGHTATVTGTQSTATVLGLSNGTSYRFAVTATNTAGTSAASTPSNTVTPTAPATAPQAPTGVNATPGRGEALVRWTPPSDDGRSQITHYVITTTDGGATATVDGGSTTGVVSGLTNGTSYRFIVTAVNSNGSSPSSSPSAAVTPIDRPAKVAKPAVSLRGTTATVTWKPATANGSPISSYTVVISGERPKLVAPAKRTAVFRGLDRGVHTVQVTATNAAGTSSPSKSVRFKVR